MRKLIFLLPFLFCSCACLLSQVPPQTIYVDENCEGVIPDYTLIVIASDNCSPVVLTQEPEPGFVLDVNTPTKDVIITGTDEFNNIATMIIPVVLIDTIPPILEWPEGQVAMGEDGVVQLYENWVAAVKVNGLAKFIYDQSWTQGIPFADTAFIMNQLHYFTNIIELTDSEYSEFEEYANNQ